MKTSVLLAILLVAYGAPVRVDPVWCSAPEIGIWTLSSVRSTLADGGPRGQLMYAFPRVPPDSAVLVTDERICQRAARAYYRHQLGPMPRGGVTVVRVGNRYAVAGDKRAGEWTILTVYSNEFQAISSVAQ